MRTVVVFFSDRNCSNELPRADSSAQNAHCLTCRPQRVEEHAHQHTRSRGRLLFGLLCRALVLGAKLLRPGPRRRLRRRQDALAREACFLYLGVRLAVDLAVLAVQELRQLI